jgi:hypothetical protein
MKTGHSLLPELRSYTNTAWGCTPYRANMPDSILDAWVRSRSPSGRKLQGMQLRAEDIAQWVTRIVIAVLVVAVAVGCASRSKLNRRTAEKLIVATLMKKPPVVIVEPRVIVPLMMQRRSDWEALLSGLGEKGYQFRIRGGPPSFREEVGPLFARIGPDVEIWLSLPEDVGALDVGPYRGCYALEEEKGRLVRYGKQVKVRVTGIRIQDGGTQAVVEYAYEWEVDKEAEKALERLQERFDDLKEGIGQLQLSFLPGLPKIEFPKELKGEATIKLQLYDDGWRVVEPHIFPGHEGPFC